MFCKVFLHFCQDFFSNAISADVCGSIDFNFHERYPTKLMEIMQIEHFLQSFLHFSAQSSNAISSEVPVPIDFKCYMRHPGEGLYQNYEIMQMQQLCQQSIKAYGPLVHFLNCYNKVNGISLTHNLKKVQIYNMCKFHVATTFY